ncbi:MAG: ribonuclease E [Azospirillum sp.]|nr:ribonuclease E [Azospirillum sp.]
MTAVEILIDRAGPLLRAAVIGDQLDHLHLDRSDRPSLQGAIYLGRIQRIVPSIAGAFVDLGADGRGFLAAADLRPTPEPGARLGARISGGQTVLVQVKSDPAAGKAAALTMDLTLPGRFLGLQPLGSGVKVSRRLPRDRSDRLRQRLAGLVPGEGWCARAAADQAPDHSLLGESAGLMKRWQELSARAAESAAPTRLAAGPDAAVRTLLDHGGGQIAAIRIESDPDAAAIERWCQSTAPELSGKIVGHRGRPGLFELRGLDEELQSLTRRRVTLPGGGGLAIDRTEALTVVDVNGGDRCSPLQVNLEAAREIPRQLRLRNLAGIVVVDFVSMSRRGDGARLLAALGAAAAADPVRTEIHGLSRLGLVEITRARRGVPVADLLAEPKEAPP